MFFPLFSFISFKIFCNKKTPFREFTYNGKGDGNPSPFGLLNLNVLLRNQTYYEQLRYEIIPDPEPS